MASKFQLPPEKVAGLQQAQRDMHDLLKEFDMADECGIDCQEYRRVHGEYMTAIDNLLRNYGPPLSKG